MPLISVIMPVYNVEQYLRRSIESVLNQTFKDFELICINDGSTDNSLEILNEYATTDPRIQIINQENAGQSVARNTGISVSNGDFIMFLDADDFYHNQTLEIMLDTVQKSKSDVAGMLKILTSDKNCNTLYNKKYSSKTSAKTYSNPLDYILKNNFHSSVIWNKIYKSQIIKDKKFIEGMFFEDWPWITCLFSEINSYTVIEAPLYFYNNQNTSTMRSAFTTKKIEDYAKGIKSVAQYYKQENKKHLWQQVKKYRISNSVKMMINKTYKEKNKTKLLISLLLEKLNQLRTERIWQYKHLPIKVIFRLFKMYIKGC